MKSEISNPKSRRDFKSVLRRLELNLPDANHFLGQKQILPGSEESLNASYGRNCEEGFSTWPHQALMLQTRLLLEITQEKNLNKILLGFFCHLFFVCENFRLLNVRKYRRNIKKISFYLCKCLSFPQENFFFVFVLETCEISFQWKFTPIFIFIFFFIYYGQNTLSY